MAVFETQEPYRQWKVRLTVGLCEQVKADLGIDIGNAIKDSEKFTEVLIADASKIVSILWMCCEKQAVAAGITPEQFGCLFDGDVLDAATSALLESVVDFFPKALGREGMKKGLPRILAKMESETNAEIERRLNLSLSIPSPSAGSTPESAGSTPAT